MQQLAPDAACAFEEEIAVDGNDLGHVGYRVLGKPGGFRWKEDVSRGFDQASVGHEDNGDNGAEAATIEGITLYNDDRPSVSGFGAVGFTEIGPPHFATFDYHASRGSERACFKCCGFRRFTDPFDRMLISQAIAHGLAIVTPDPVITQYPVRAIW